MRTILLTLPIWLLLALCGCASEQPVYRPVTVEVPVSQAMKIQPITKPDFATTHVRISDGVDVKVRAAFVELDQRKAYEARLIAEIDGLQ